MQVKIDDEEAQLVAIRVLKKAYIECQSIVTSSTIPQEQKDFFLDVMVGFPLVLRYFLDDDEYEHFFERINKHDDE